MGYSDEICMTDTVFGEYSIEYFFVLSVDVIIMWSCDFDKSLYLQLLMGYGYKNWTECLSKMKSTGHSSSVAGNTLICSMDSEKS